MHFTSPRPVLPGEAGGREDLYHLPVTAEAAPQRPNTCDLPLLAACRSCSFADAAFWVLLLRRSSCKIRIPVVVVVAIFDGILVSVVLEVIALPLAAILKVLLHAVRVL